MLRRSRRRPVRFDPDRPYQVYTREFDAEIKADDLDAFLAELPDRRWAERFPEVDPAQLYDLENDLAARRAGMETTQPQAADTIVSLLIDHSGSMRGQPMLFAARAALVASDLLDGLGAKQEVLGFTTSRWKGGRSREKWFSSGQPSYPGRLNDLLHIVYCSAGEKLSARHCASMLRRDLVKENIDGEALEWAASRLRRSGERQKYLIVLSDGAPVDDPTLLANGDRYLSHHLSRVTDEIEQAGDIRLAAIGIGHPVEQYYEQGITINAPEELEDTLVQLINRLLRPSP
ncbi:cobalamin biosynthesis protein CobT [Bradyrhizobium sp. WYCCWR 13023]|uniref:Cobalamin biosynthesis protein CobT n=1 Tax=Bradyrhizobium zhengyangense TaxID=2911009 RepID=A0A9X1UAV2_9BRAD|nr:MULTISPECIES: cobalamin biosynthesis protein CobT [Bradyrhizobium]MCG2628393.1 cobalamin biosynthesis protein CobT [Bradyrhizobium zhengyangense]MCG2640211.1 cobalamin biosynthesis protein CobT [Bradyrhizobium zhengyangense]MCG2665493.1 cobalamin biosynthesis protein CobT [Bradyrhizobium zhengyangense]